MSTIPETKSCRDASQEENPSLELLSRPESYPERPATVDRVETHISWVFLTERHAYKLKKPVRFDFLDFSTPDLRRKACEDEVRLNRRLAPHVYLGVVPVTRQGRGRLQLGGTGAPIDWVVKMRRLSAARSLDQLIRQQTLTSTDMERLSERLTQFYQGLPPTVVRTADYVRQVEHHVRDNRRLLLESSLAANVVKRTHTAQLRLILLAPEMFGDRVRDGRIVEGHGDLRPEHVYLDPTPTVIDCVEFNTELRQLDVADELSFLAMECARLGAPQIGDRIVEHYCQRCDDQPPKVLLSFYKSYRACVRTKVLSLRADQVAAAADRPCVLLEADEYLRVADHYAAQLGPPMLILVRGLPGSGKSTLAAAIAGATGAELLETDIVRRELFGTRKSSAGFSRGKYSVDNRKRVYRELARRAELLLRDRVSVVLDGTFTSATSRAELLEIANNENAVAKCFQCTCPHEVALERISRRAQMGDIPSEADRNVYLCLVEENEPDPPEVVSSAIDTDRSHSSVVRDAVEQIANWYPFPG